MTPRIALATCSALPELPDDERPLLEELRSSGVDANPEVWTDHSVAWDAYDLVILRSTWDYHERPEEFIGWAQSVPRILNSPQVVSWNIDKRYLASVPHAVSTEFLAPGQPLNPPDGEYVVKPAISAGSRDTARYGPQDHERAEAHVRRLHAADRTILVQPYLDAVDRLGETALLFFGGKYSHAIGKGQMLLPGRPPAFDLYVAEEITARQPTPAEHAVAEEVLQALPWPPGELLYARVDLILDGDGAPRLVELELTEPSLFFSYCDGAARRLADEVLARI